MSRFLVDDQQLGSVLGQEEIDAVADVIRSGEGMSYSGENVPLLEQEFAAYCGAQNALAVSSGTGALRIAAQLLRLRAGDEIVAATQTFTATVLEAFARNVSIRFADIDPRTLNMDPASLEARITPKTKAIFLVHYGGNPCDMDPIMEIARGRDIAVVEDAAHAPGAEYKGRRIGGIGDITCFSFQSMKNMTSGGEGGMLTTNNPDFADEARMLRTMGILGQMAEKDENAVGPYAAPDPPLSDHSMKAYTHEYKAIEEWGTHDRISDLLAAIGRIQLQKLDDLNARCIEIGARLNRAIDAIDGFRTWHVDADARCVYHLYPVFIDRSRIKAPAVEVIRFFEDECRVQIVQRYFPQHLTNYAHFRGHRFGECPVCERVFFEEQINLPISARMTDEQVDVVINAVRAASDRFCE
jgi:perosamine synthetase